MLCEEVFARAQALLDDDFLACFRRETPQRMSELLFEAVFLDAGWEPIDRVLGSGPIKGIHRMAMV